MIGVSGPMAAGVALIVGTLVAGVAMGGAAQPPASGHADGARKGPPPALVVMDEVRSEVIEQWREVTGQLRPVRRTLLATREEGLVLALEAEPGDLVQKGQIVARLDDTRRRLVVERDEADVRVKSAILSERRANLDILQRDLERVRAAAERSSASQSEFDRARTGEAAGQARLEQAQAELAVAKAALALSRQRLDDLTIRVPFTGWVISKRAEVGQWVNAGGEIIEVVSASQIEAWIDVPERAIERISGTGVRVRIRVPALGVEIEAPVTRIVPDADALSRLFPVRVRLDNASGRLRPGMSVVGLIPTGTRARSLTVQKDAILRDDAGEYVYIDAGGTALPVRVHTLFATGDRVAVRGDRLEPGARVVIEGNERLFPGAVLQVSVPVSPPSAAQPAGDVSEGDHPGQGEG